MRAIAGPPPALHLGGMKSARLAVCAVSILAACGRSTASKIPSLEGPPPDGGTTTSPARTWPPPRPGYVSPIPGENALPGDGQWDQGREAYARQIELYLDRVSVSAGAAVRVMASADGPHTATWTLYRFGWYGGAGARRVAGGGPVSVSTQAACPMVAATGLVRCGWTATAVVQVPADAVSGLYAVKLVRDDGFMRFAPLVVTDDRPADLLLQASVDTWQAYNGWGGESLYTDGSHTLPNGLAVQVSFDRPYAANMGLSDLRVNEAPFARFLEKHGYDVSYTTNAQVALAGAQRLELNGAFLSVGHDEYWAGEERDAVDAARDAGVPVLVFGGNAAYWKIRYEAFAQPDNPRVITCYKGRSAADPVQGAGVTGRYRDPPVDRPENELLGGMYAGWQLLIFPWVAGPASWLVEGAGLAPGDALPGLVGNEYDRRQDNGFEPPHVVALARSPVVNAEEKPDWSETLAYRAGASGALVFDAGTIFWTRGLDPAAPAYDARVERMTANVFHEALGLAVPDALSQPSPRPRPAALGPYASSVDTTTAALAAPAGLALRPGGGLVIVDAGRHQVLEWGGSGPPQVVAGDGTFSSDPRYDGVPGAQARFSFPTAAVVAPDGAILVADTNNHCVRRIGTDAERTVTTFAGAMGREGFADGPAATARFAFPSGLAYDPRSGNLLVADSSNHRIRSVDAAGNVTTLVGSVRGDRDGPAATALIDFPTAIAAAPDGRIFVVCTFIGEVKVILTDAARTVVTLAGVGAQGSGDGAGNVAGLGAQGGAAWTGQELAFSDPVTFGVRALVPGATAATTTVHTLAGSGAYGAQDGPAESATFALPIGLASAGDGTVWVADAGGGTVRVIRP